MALRDLEAARAASRQYRSDARRLRSEAELATEMGHPDTAKQYRYCADMAMHAATREMRAALTETAS